MALLSDSRPTSIEHLTAIDGSVLDLARMEGIDLTVKLNLAAQTVIRRIEGVLAEATESRGFFYASERLTASNVVIDDELRDWAALESLAQIYRDVAFSQLNDRYSSRQTHFEMLAAEAFRRYLRRGVGVVSRPLHRPPKPEVEEEDGVLSSTTYYIAATIGTAGDESEPSELVALNAKDGHRLVVSGPAYSPMAEGWHLYAGYTPDGLVRQNAELITQPFAAITASLVSVGPSLPSGQRPNFYVRPFKTLRRG